ncbi:MAG: alanine racemase [Bacillota bacterium]|nr:alanine racemase [Bacillota bacterium]
MKKMVIEKEKLKHNLDIIKNMTSSTIIAVLKGNGYGLGILDYARFLTENSVNYFAVSELDDAILLRESGFESKILLLTSTSVEEEAEAIVKYNIMPTVGSQNSALAINEAAKRLDKIADIHLKIDTGFGRFGFLWDKWDEISEFLKDLKNIRIEGTYSHLSFPFEKKPKSTHIQFEKYRKCIDGLKANGINPGILHIANSCTFLRFPSMHLDAVRIGSALLGRIPIENRYDLYKIAYLKSNIVEVKDLPANHFIGYANTFKTKRPTRIGIVPVGYMDGYGVEKSRDTFRFRDILRYVYHDLKTFKKKIYIKLGDKKAVPVLGRISMFNIVVDLTGTDAKLGDEVFMEINPILIESTVRREFI